MSQIKITSNAGIVARALKEIDLGRALQEGIVRYAFAIEREAKILVSGELLNVQTGRLRASIMTDIGNLRAKIGPHVSYAGFLHEGTRFITPRPFMTRGVDRANQSGEGVEGLTTAIKTEIDGKLKMVK